MIDGTRPYKGKNLLQKTDASSVEEVAHAPGAHDSAVTSGETQAPVPDAVDQVPVMNRRAWFTSLVPALGDGLVQILRASNHLRDDLDSIRKSRED